MYNMVVFDLDGTLLNSKGTISNNAIKTLEKLSNRGYIITVATGRSMIGIPNCVKSIPYIDYYITSNGASCIDKSGVHIFKNWIDFSSIKSIIKKDYLVEYLIDGKWYIDSQDEGSLKKIIKDTKIANYILNTRIRIDNIEQKFEHQNVYFEKINLNFPIESYEKSFVEIYNEINQNKKLRVWTDRKHKLDIYSKLATKGNAVKQLSEYLKINQKQIIAFGDDDNDLEMLTFVGCPVAMKNGNDNIKKIAKGITNFTNDEDGVTIFLQNLIENGVLKK